MRFNAKIIITAFIFLSMLFLKAFAADLSQITDIIINKTGDNKTEIKVNSNGPFRYFINSEGNRLHFDIKDAKLSAKLINTLNNTANQENSIDNIILENLSENKARVTLCVQELRNFKFTMSAPSGKANPYGFTDHEDPKIANKEVNKENIKKIPVKVSQMERPVEKKEVREPELNETYNQFETEEDLIMPGNYPDNSTSVKLKEFGAGRLNENNIVVPDNFSLSNTTSTNENIETQKPDEKSVVKNEELTSQPLTAEELFKRLNSDNSEVPRLVDQEKPKNKSAEVVIEDKYDDEVGLVATKMDTNKDNNVKVEQPDPIDTIIKDIKPFPKGKFVKINDNKPNTMNASAALDISSSTESSPTHTEVDDDMFYPPRELNYMSLGLSEQFRYIEKKTNKLSLSPESKPGLTSDGKLAFTVYTPQGKYSGQAQKKYIEKPDSDNYSAVKQSELPLQDTMAQNEFKRLINDAKEYYRIGRYEESERAFKEAIAKNSDQPWGYIAIADFFEKQKRYSEAIIAYENAKILLPGKAEILYNLALNYYKLDDYNKSQDYLARVISLSPDFTLAYYNLGTLYYKQKDLQSAIEYLSRTIALNPLLTDAHYNIGLAYMANNDLKAATKHFEECLNIDSEDTACRIMLEKTKEKS